MFDGSVAFVKTGGGGYFIFGMCNVFQDLVNTNF